MRNLPLGPRLHRGLLFFWCAFASGGLYGAPYRPANDSMELERLPAGSVSAFDRAAEPRNVDAAVTIARRYIERARHDGDPRFLGYAEGVLLPWWNEASPPLAVLLLRSTLLQSRHRFDEALRDLNRVLDQAPGEPQALLTKATVLRVQGRYAEAMSACAALDGKAGAFVTDLCLASIRSLSGELPGMARVLDDMATESRTESPGVQAWYRAERADMAERQGNRALALRRYREAIDADGGDPILRASMADLLLRMGRPRDALEVTGDSPTADVARLRTAIAARNLGQPRVDLETALADAYAAAHRRNEDMHLREEGRFVLEVQHDAPRALSLARQNWAIQREPADVLLLKDAGAAAGNAEARATIQQWLQSSRLQDARLIP